MNPPVNGLVSTTRTDDWEAALISGNGRQGALCHGGPEAVRITLSHERLFLPLTPPLDPPPTVRILPELRSLLAAGQHRRAAERVVEFAAEQDPGYATTRWVDPLVGAAVLTCTPVAAAGPSAGPSAGGVPATGYRRSTDFDTGVVRQSWRSPEGTVEVAAFVSRPHDALVVRLTGPTGWHSGLGVLDEDPPVPMATTIAPDGLGLRVEFPAATGRQVTGYTVRCRALRGGTLLLLRTTVDGVPSPGPELAELPADFDALLAAHVAVHGELVGRVRLDLAGSPAARTATTEELLAPLRPDTVGGTAESGSTAEPDTSGGNALLERLFAAGRYAIVSACGDLPPTLLGVWSGSYRPAWSGGYTLNGNLPAALAALAVTGTPELVVPLFDLLDSVADDLTDNARRLYGAAGILTPTHLTSHGRQNHFGPVWCQTFWTAGAAWLGRLYHDHWCHTGDRTFLRERALPFLRRAAEFYLDFVTVGPDGRARFAPSYSPENAPANTGAQASLDATMDVAAVGDLLRNLLTATAALGEPDPAEPGWRALLAALPPYRIAPTGELAEWIAPELHDNHAHRHASQLYPLWYEIDPAFAADPALRRAATLAIRHRLAWWQGAESDEMGYGLAQLGLAAARLGLAEEAYRTVLLMAGRYWRPNLVSTHNRDAIFNLDLCGGFPAVIAAMLLRSSLAPGHSLAPGPGPGAPSVRLDLLPALPPAWPRGSVCGLLARGPVTVTRLAWTPTEVETSLTSPVDREVAVGLPGRDPVRVELAAGRTHRLRSRR
ncbi:glycoside hydrolase N-terminal domain-containing protein [Plantactinospora sp. B6F1]|uniref:glycosyl hydrolase family 95 catalytic domain-containing protein n=1 Tax=Plantactinospora sp. B6F1 TaxID=3158971 RepID=UPI0032D9565F